MHGGSHEACLAKGEAFPLCALAPHQALLDRGPLALALGSSAILQVALSLHSRDNQHDLLD